MRAETIKAIRLVDSRWRQEMRCRQKEVQARWDVRKLGGRSTRSGKATYMPPPLVCSPENTKASLCLEASHRVVGVVLNCSYEGLETQKGRDGDRPRAEAADREPRTRTEVRPGRAGRTLGEAGCFPAQHRSPVSPLTRRISNAGKCEG